MKKNESFVLFVFLLFIGTSIIPATAHDTEKTLPETRGSWLNIWGNGPRNSMKVPSVDITINGGFGVTVLIKNNGFTNLTNVNWSIAFDGKFIFVGKYKSANIHLIPAGESVLVMDFIVGFGMTRIVAEAGGVQASASGTVILFLFFKT
jgi:hypothetical protein